ncbi:MULTISPECIES: NTP transferase domain-containing protein [Stenotrophomonas]|uniref:NTP transferase domain-containing protein n=1 Tax=Stenotrophomonas sp. CFBP8994 TaxID=3096527 RepID=UPI002A6A6D2D|nr:NTP transferase domain-containing protein [Stenotrophomonas sp. CFBP8994]MDY0981792.1 NTP transferase domain-containing protein [Stenotrophomonas sp. CFBP8994]
MNAPLSALLLTGGASRRMQADKALLDYAGQPQLLRAWALLRHVEVVQAFVSLRPDQRGETLRGSLPTLVDSVDSVGPVAGILSAQQAFPGHAWLVIACDLPLLDARTLRALVAARQPVKDATAFVSRHDDLPEPLCAIWEPSSAPLLRQRFDAGNYCPRKALLQLQIHALPSPGSALDNVNTPGELLQARQQLETS